MYLQLPYLFFHHLYDCNQIFSLISILMDYIELELVLRFLDKAAIETDNDTVEVEERKAVHGDFAQ